VSFRTARARVLAAMVTLATSMLLVTAHPGGAWADATGCTSAPGYTGALNCVAVYGSGLHVDSAQSRYQPGVTPYPQQLCNRNHQWQFRRYGATGYTSKSLTATGCILGVLPDYLDWANPGQMSNNSSFCARTNNTHTGGVWSPFACETITY
jgi:hypothetical protein